MQHGRDMDQPIPGAKPEPLASTALGSVDRPKFCLTDEQRDEIAKLSGIPRTVAANDAWAMIEVLIATYRGRKNSRDTAMLPAEVRDELRAIRDDAEELWKRLSQLQVRQPVDWSMSFPEMSALFDLGMRCSLLASDIEPAKRGPNRDVYVLIANLDGIRWEFTRKTISRSYKSTATSYITYVCALADPDIGTGTIDKAMKSVIERRKRRGLVAAEIGG
jgi:hypothetical protein